MYSNDTCAPASVGIIASLGNERRDVAGLEGETLFEALKRAGLPIMSVCGGRASCGACRIGVAPAWTQRLPLPENTERNLLDCLPDSRASHRLACQIRLSRELEGLEIDMGATVDRETSIRTARTMALHRRAAKEKGIEHE
ncbi:MAG: 2Fe-2S iron-sulfur cluster-binding protein [Gammaproteobacteria bacterium]